MRDEGLSSAILATFLDAAVGKDPTAVEEAFRERVAEAARGFELEEFVREVLDEAVVEALPEFLRSLEVESVDCVYKNANDYSFECETELSIEGQPLALVISVGKEKKETTVGGTITLGQDADGDDLRFRLIFSTDTEENTFLATVDNARIPVRGLVGAVSPDFAEAVPGDLEIRVARALFAYRVEEAEPKEEGGGENGKGKWLFAFTVDLGAEFDISGLPVVGGQLPADLALGLGELQFLVCQSAFDQATLEGFNELLSGDGGEDEEDEERDGASESDDDSEDEDTDDAGLPEIDLGKGVHLAALFELGDESKRLSLPIGRKTKDVTPAAERESDESETEAGSESGDQAASPQKSFGPVFFEKVELAYRDRAAWVLLECGVTGGGLTLTFDGLGFGCSLDDPFPPEFALEGIGLSYKSGAVSLSGALQRRRIGEGAARRDQYAGAAILQAPSLSLTAIGAYEELEGKPSMFLYGVLDKPIGGPAFFFVTGLAAGFGYNRRLILPTIDEIEDFPLIRAAMQKGSAEDPLDAALAMLDNLEAYLPASIGDSFVAIGVRFTSFKIIESFALVTIAFGERSEVGLLGIATLVAPPKAGKTALARVQIGLVARIDDATLQIDGKVLEGSYVYAKDCALTGGFAFYSWFAGEHEGDFVLTVGGYHPDFRVPAHYPEVGRLQLNWQISDKVSLKGNCYFALTASALMAGGALEAVYKDGNLKAWFKAGAHFLVIWEPYHYDARIRVSVGASYKFELDLGLFTISKTISVEVGASVHIWGPEFGGSATVDIYVISFTIYFGAGEALPDPIPWSTFKSSFLPRHDEVCTLTAHSGLVASIKQGAEEVWVVNPRSFELSLDSAIPFTATNHDLDGAGSASRPAIRSMGVSTAQLSSELGLFIEGPQAENFEIRPIYKQVPQALWGAPTAEAPGPNDERLLPGALAGLEIRPLPPPEPDRSSEILREKLLFNLDSHPAGYRWGAFDAFSKLDVPDDYREREAPEELLDAFGIVLRGETIAA